MKKICLDLRNHKLGEVCLDIRNHNVGEGLSKSKES